jgi:iron complex outermembrane receptor protein
VIQFLSAVALAAAAPVAESSDSETIVVTGQRVTDVSGAGKTDTPIKEIPYSINVIDRELLDLRLPRNFVEALRTTPGLTQTSPRISTQNLRSRGFSLRQAGGEYRNALRHYSQSNLAPELTNVERFELVKGPASVLYGIGGLGGALNVVTKVPNPEPRYEVEAGIGSYGFYRGAVDLNMPLGDAWSVRLNAHRERTGSYQDFVDQDSQLVAPTLAWRPDDDTSLVLDFEYLKADLSGNRTGTPYDGAVVLGPNGRYDRSLQLFDPNFNEIVRVQYYAGYQFDRKLSDTLKFHSGLLYAWSDPNRSLSSDPTSFVGGFTGPRRVVNRTLGRFAQDWNSLAWDNNLTATFATGPIRHELLAGFDYFRHNDVGTGESASIAPLDIFAPVYGLTQTTPFVQTSSSRAYQKWWGVYLQHTLIPHDSLRILLSGRFTDIETISENRRNQALTRRAKDKPFVPRVGVVWTPVEPLSLYASYSESFTPVTGLAFDGTPFVPETGSSYEGGAKLSLAGGRMSATVAVFDMARQNVLTADPVPGRIGFSVQTGESTSKGTEVEIDGEVLPGWRLTASYAFLDTEISKDNSLLVGQPFAGIPRNAFNLFTTYRIGSGSLEGLGVSAGLFNESRRWVQLVTPANAATNGLFIPGYTRADAGISFRRAAYDVTLSVNNVFDRTYFSGVLGRFNIYYGEGRNVTAALRYRF